MSHENKGRALRVGLLAVVLILLAASVGWNFMTKDASEVQAHSRRSMDFEVTWHCLDCGHEEVAQGGNGPKQCPKCKHDAMYSSVRFRCPEHGEYVVALLYNDNGRIDKVKVGDGEWVPYVDEEKGAGTVCPVCGQLLTPPGH